MKNSIYIVLLFLIGIGCTTPKSKFETVGKSIATKNDTVRIANDELKYEVIIIDPGFNFWLTTRALPRSYYTQSFLESKNRLYVSEWNSRVLQSQRYNSDLYERTIDYNFSTDYGFEVNYLIYNYMVYFQNTFKQKLRGYVPFR